MSRLGSLFSGYGGLEMGVAQVLDVETAWVADIDPGVCRILAHRYPDVPNLGDVSKVKWTPDCPRCGDATLLDRDGAETYRCDRCRMMWPVSYGLDQLDGGVEPIDILTAGFPCQPVSHAGKRLGDQDERWLWDEVARAIGVLRPRLVVLENVRGLLSAGWGRLFGRVLGDLADLGYDAQWCGVRAADVGAPHGRFRVFIAAADAERGRRDGWSRGAGRRPLRGVASERSGADTPADAADLGHERTGRARRRWAGPSDGGLLSTPRATRGGEGTETVTLLPTPMVGSTASAAHGQISGQYRDAMAEALGQWGIYAAAIRRWEALTRPAPAPTQPGRNGNPQLSPAFVEWLMGLPEGWVTDDPGLNRNAQLKALGNGVVPAQAAHALRWLLEVAEGVA